MTRQRKSYRAASALVILSLAITSASADPPVATAQVSTSPEQSILKILRSNPVTAPYAFAVKTAGKQFALSGRVGSRQVHDVAIRSTIALGYPVRDDLIIDTREADRIAAQSGYPRRIGIPYYYPPPLFGRLDDPFLGFEPALVSYPPYWGAIANRPSVRMPAVDTAGLGPATVQLSLDPQGVAYLTGQVATQAEKESVAIKVGGVRGVGGVVNELEVVGGGPMPSDTPPPPPTPAFLPPRPPNQPPVPVPTPDLSEQRPAIGVNADPVTKKVIESLGKRPLLSALSVKVSGKDGVVTLTGSVPSAYEAMLAFRTAAQTPGVREVFDRLQFTMPDDDDKNPLRLKGRPEDVEPYLTAQIRRQLGDLAHLDRVRLQGESIEIVGSVSAAADIARVEATIRSIPLLRGFRIEPKFQVD